MRTAIRLTTAFAIFATLAGGCAKPDASIDFVRATVMKNSARGPAVSFSADITAKNLAGAQLIYQVEVVDRSGNPLVSTDGVYQNRKGYVSGARTVLCVRSPQQFNDLNVAIPTSQLEVVSEQLPISAIVGLYTVGGRTLAETDCGIPAGGILVKDAFHEGQPSPGWIEFRQANYKPHTRR